MYVYTIYTRPLTVQAQYSRSCPIISSPCYSGSLVINLSNDIWSVLYSLGTDRTGNAASNSSSIVACVSLLAIRWRLLSYCLTTGVFTEPFPSNSCLWWLSSDMPQYEDASGQGPEGSFCEHGNDFSDYAVAGNFPDCGSFRETFHTTGILRWVAYLERNRVLRVLCLPYVP
jgi:hypothetical protein